MIAEILDINNKCPRTAVLFSTVFGQAYGFWDGAVPIKGENYHVEFDICGMLKWGEDIVAVPCGDKEKIGFDDEYMAKITGIFCELEDDGYTVMRLADSLISFVSYGLPDKVPCKIQVKCKELTLYPYEL